MKIELSKFFFRTRIIFLIAALSLAAKYIYANFLTDASVYGVVAASVVNVNAPIEGHVTLGDGVMAPGDRIRSGQEIFKISNSKFNDNFQLNSQKELRLNEAQQAKVELQLRQVHEDINSQVERERKMSKEQIQIFRSRVERDTNFVNEARIKSEELAQNLERQRTLMADGYVSKAMFEAIESEARQAKERLSGLRNNIEAEKAALFALENGTEVEDGAFPSLAALRAKIGSLRIEARQLEADLVGYRGGRAVLASFVDSSESLAKNLTNSVIRARADGIALESQWLDQAWVAQGQHLASYAECSRLFALVIVKRRLFAKIATGHMRNADVVVDDKTYPGRVVQSSLMPQATELFFPTWTIDAQRPEAIADFGYVVVRIDSDRGELNSACPLGSPAEVRFRN